MLRYFIAPDIMPPSSGLPLKVLSFSSLLPEDLCRFSRRFHHFPPSAPFPIQWHFRRILTVPFPSSLFACSSTRKRLSSRLVLLWLASSLLDFLHISAIIPVLQRPAFLVSISCFPLRQFLPPSFLVATAPLCPGSPLPTGYFKSVSRLL